MNIRKRFRNWLKPDCPFALSMEDWRVWHREYRKNYPVRYKIDKWLSSISNFFYRLKHRWWKTRDFVTQRNVKVRTGLTPGYYDKCDLMLHTMMNMLVDYVEVDCASSHLLSRVMKNEKDAIRTYRMWRWLPFYNFRSSDYGIAYLAWETTLDCPDLDPDERSPHQAEVAREVIAIYSWWKNEYPKYEEIWEQGPTRLQDFNLRFEASDDPEIEAQYQAERAEMKRHYDWLGQQEDMQKRTIEEMTLRLMRIRTCLWR